MDRLNGAGRTQPRGMRVLCEGGGGWHCLRRGGISRVNVWLFPCWCGGCCDLVAKKKKACVYVAFFFSLMYFLYFTSFFFVQVELDFKTEKWWCWCAVEVVCMPDLYVE